MSYDDDSDSDYVPDSDDTPCDDTTYHDDDCSLKSPYDTNVRTYFYPSGYRATTLAWKAGRLTALQDPGDATKFICRDVA